MRIAILTAIVISLVVYAWRDWFVSVCALVVLAALMKHPDMPTQIFGIQGVNLWNILFANVVLAWLLTRKKGNLWRVMPQWVWLAFFAYVALMMIAFLRGCGDLSNLRTDISLASFISDYLINPIKYTVVSFLLFDGAQNRRNITFGLMAVGAYALLVALMALRYIPIGTLLEVGGSSEAESAFRHRFQKEVGFHANHAALILVVGFWLIGACRSLWWRRWWLWLAGISAALFILIALALTNSRAGYCGLLGVGLIFGFLRSRALLLAVPVASIVLVTAFPNIEARLTFGFGVTDVAGEEVQDWDAISAGRTTYLWPPTLEEISKYPIIGQGRMAMLRTPVFDRICEYRGSCPEHPHNAYLEMLLDSGAIGMLIALIVFAGFPLLAFLRRCKEDPLLNATAMTGVAAAGAIAIMAITGQSFWPQQGMDIVFYAYGIMMGGYAITASRRNAMLGRYGATYSIRS